MNYHKIGGRHVLLSDSKIARPALDWLTEQPECTNVGVQGSRVSGQYDGRPGAVRVLRAEASRLWTRFYGERWMTDARVDCGDADAAARLVVKLCQRYGYPPPAGAAAPVVVRPAAPAPAPRLVHAAPAADAIVDAARPVTQGVQSSMRLVTPEVAARWLERVKAQRKTNAHVVKRYMADMLAGRWGVSESAIAFNTNGDLINGQHRLWAVLESGVTITALVATGYDPAAIVHFDDGFVRGAADTYRLLHPTTEADKISLAVAGRLVHALWKGGQNTKTPRQELFVAMDRWAEGISFAKQHVGKGAGGGVRVSAVLAAVVRAFYDPAVDHERLRQFGHVLTTGLSNGPEDSAAVLLRNWLQTHGKNNVGAQEEAYRKTERAIRAFLDREEMKRNLYPAAKELFPLPGETTAETEQAVTGRPAWSPAEGEAKV